MKKNSTYDIINSKVKIEQFILNDEGVIICKMYFSDITETKKKLF